MTGKSFWTAERLERLKALAGAGVCGTDICVDIGTTRQSVIVKAFQLGIALIKYTPEEQAEFDRRAKLRSSNKKRRRANEKRRDRRVVVADSVSKTSAIYRNRFARLPEMTKNELRAMLSQAVRNTAEASV